MCVFCILGEVLLSFTMHCCRNPNYTATAATEPELNVESDRPPATRGVSDPRFRAPDTEEADMSFRTEGQRPRSRESMKNGSQDQVLGPS